MIKLACDVVIWFRVREVASDKSGMEFVPLLLRNEPVAKVTLENSAMGALLTSSLEVVVPLRILCDVSGPTAAERAVIESVAIRLEDWVSGTAIVDVATSVLEISGGEEVSVALERQDGPEQSPSCKLNDKLRSISGPLDETSPDVT
jgi:hypothetical protein